MSRLRHGRLARVAQGEPLRLHSVGTLAKLVVLHSQGPDGPKSLCNACGLRYAKVRSKEKKAAKAGLENLETEM